MSDYTPPTLVIPTPGGNPGDGSINGNLTLLANSGPPNATNILYVGNQRKPVLQVQGTYPGDIVLFGPDGNGYLTVGSGAVDVSYLEVNGGTLIINGVGKISNYTSIGTVGMGVAPIYGKDARTGLTAADASAKTLYTTTAAGQVYRLMGRILATAGTSPSATYTIKWTEGGATITKTLTISALDSDSDLSILIQPDNGTAITAQLTAISGTGTTVNVAATVEQMA